MTGRGAPKSKKLEQRKPEAKATAKSKADRKSRKDTQETKQSTREKSRTPPQASGPPTPEPTNRIEDVPKIGSKKHLGNH